MLAIPLWAQVSPVTINFSPAASEPAALATDFTGSQIFMTTRMRPVGTNFSANPKLLRLSRSFHGLQWSVLMEGGQMNLSPNLPSFLPPTVSFDGSVVAIKERTSCLFRSAPGAAPPFIGTTLLMGGNSIPLPHLVSISPNGKHVLVYGDGRPANCTAGGLGPEIFRFDPQSRSKTMIGSAPAEEGQFVSNDGAALVRVNGTLQLLGSPGQTTLQIARRMQWAHLSADAKRVVYASNSTEGSGFTSNLLFGQSPTGIGVYDLTTGTDRLLAIGTDPKASADGRQVAYLAGSFSVSQLWVVDTVTGLSRPLARIAEGVASHAMAGNGEVVIVATSKGRLLSISVPTGIVTELLGPAPLPPYLDGSAAPGSLFRLARAVPVGIDLIGVSGSIPGTAPLPPPQVFVAGDPAILVSSDNFRFSYQTPWETKVNEAALVAVRESSSPWEFVVPIGTPTVFPAATSTSHLEPDPAYAYHDNWQQVVSRQRPARLGEVVHMYGSGFGPVVGSEVGGSIATGRATPTGKLFPLAADCKWRATAHLNAQAFDPMPFDFTPEFAGLAPGLVGVYQFDLKIPGNWSAPTFVAYCAKPNDSHPGLLQPEFILPSLPVAAPNP